VEESNAIMSSIFLSHNHADKPFVRRLATDLRQAGIKVWIDEAEILLGESLVEKIRQGIDEMDFLGVVLSEDSIQSEWVKREVDIAMNQEIKGKRVKVLPLLIEHCELPGFLEGKLYADFTTPEKYRTGLEQILRRLGKYVAPRKEFEPESVLIPAGKFFMGSDRQVDKDAEDDEQPQHELTLGDFYLGKYAVTITEYHAFVESTGKIPKRWGNYTKFRPEYGHHPVNWIDCFEASDYCDWLSESTGKRYVLPSEAEWEKGARGTDGRIFPWGNEWNAELCNVIEGDYYHPGRDTSTVDVANFIRGVSPYGLFQMVGNVQEWTRTMWDEQHPAKFIYPYDPNDGREDSATTPVLHRVVRGGSFRHKPSANRCAFRNIRLADSPAAYVGFRVALHQ
jgi:formylglycine-generating enzyme required for sulfatase activity